MEPSSDHSRTLALVIHALYGGGAERLMSQLANRWCSAGHQVHLITLASTTSDKYAVDAGVKRHGLDLMHTSSSFVAGLQANWTRVHALRLKLREVQPDMLLSFCDRTNIVALSAAMPLTLPIWIAEHSNPQQQVLGLFWETWRQWSYRALARRRTGGCVVLTDAIASYMQGRFPGLPLKVIPPAVNLPEPESIATARQPKTAGLSRILFLGRLSAEKNLRQLLLAWEHLATRFPQWQLVIAGDGPEMPALRALAQELKLERLEFPGWVNDPQLWLANSDIAVLPSRYEGFPVALLEAMGLQVACVSTPNSTAVEQLGKVGALTVSGGFEAEHIASSLAELMADGSRCAMIAQQGYRVVQGYSWNKVGLLWDQILAGDVAESSRISDSTLH